MTTVIDPYGVDISKNKDTRIFYKRNAFCLRGHDTSTPDKRTNGSCNECKRARDKERKNLRSGLPNRKYSRMRQDLPSWMHVTGTEPLHLYPVWAMQSMMYQRGITLADIARHLNLSRERIRQLMIAAVKGIPGHMDKLDHAISEITLARGGVYVTLSPGDKKLAQARQARVERYVNG